MSYRLAVTTYVSSQEILHPGLAAVVLQEALGCASFAKAIPKVTT